MNQLYKLTLTFSIFLILNSCQTYNQADMDLKIALDFIESINTGNIDKLFHLMSNDHEFIDSQGNRSIGNENIKKAWIGYLDLFPDYKIEITDTFHNDSIISLFGYASGTYKNLKNEENSNFWRIPAAWKVIVKDEKIESWQVYADNIIVMDIIKGNQ